MQLTSNDISPALNGVALTDALAHYKEKRLALSEGILYEQTIFMIAADPGLGKSTISTQAAIELAAGIPLFQYFKTARPLKVFYAQAERGVIEFLERVERLSGVLPIVKENIYLTDEFQKLNLLIPAHVDLMLQAIERDCPKPDIIFLDPIYALVAGGLKDDIPASAFTKAMSRVQRETGATLWYNHHTVKPQYSQKGEMIEKIDPFYGSQWLKAHVTGSYHMVKHDGGVRFIKKKDNYSLHPEQIILEYDPELELCRVNDDITEQRTPLDKVRTYLNMREIDQKQFTFKDIQSQTELCTRTLRKVLMHSSISSRISAVTTSRNKKLYKISTPNLSCAVHGGIL